VPSSDSGYFLRFKLFLLVRNILWEALVKMCFLAGMLFGPLRQVLLILQMVEIP
jgi:hypothetical protein